ncbi:MAG TPA: hypothetical protein VGP72_17050 [Planctomycetota bacterium]
MGNDVGTSNRLLQDAYVHVHDYVPHHDFKLGQFRRQMGEEGSRDDGKLDFAERAMITQVASFRDAGLQAHGSWCDQRLEYWAGVFNGAGTAFQQHGNRSDDNDQKDLAFTVRGVPICQPEDLGTLEFGYSLLNGVGGEGHTGDSDAPVPSLNRARTIHGMQYAWGAYQPGGPLRGFWLRGEWGQIRDRFAPAQAASGFDVTSTNPAPFKTDGWYVSAGYRLDKSIWCDGLTPWVRPLEFAIRYETMRNIFYHDLVQIERRFDLFHTQVYTAGINYRVSSGVKLQFNYNWVLEQHDQNREDRQLREVRNNAAVINFQVEF